MRIPPDFALTHVTGESQPNPRRNGDSPQQPMIKKTTILALAAAALLLPASAQPVPQQKLENFKHYEALKEKYLGKQITLYVTYVEREHRPDADGMPVFKAWSIGSDGNSHSFYVRVPKENVEEFVTRYGTERRISLLEPIPGLVVVGGEFTMPMKGEFVEYIKESYASPECRLQVYPASKPVPTPTPTPKPPKPTPAAVVSGLPEFLFAQNLEADRDFILHCRSPRFLLEFGTGDLFELEPVPKDMLPGLIAKAKAFAAQAE